MPSARATTRVLLVAVAVAAALYFLYLIRDVIGLLFVSIFLAVALGPVVAFFERGPIRRWMAILISYLALVVAVFGIGLLVVPPIVDEVDRLVNDLPGYVQDLRDSDTLREYDEKYGIVDKLEERAEELPSRLDDAAGALQSVTVGVFTALVQLITVLVMTFLLLLDGRRIIAFVVRELGPVRGRRVQRIGEDVYRAVGGYVMGNLLISLIAGLSTWVVLELAGVPFAVPLAVLMAFLDLIPLVGATIGGIIIGIVAAVSDFPTALIIWLAFFLVYQQVENNVLQPVIYRRTVALHPLIVLVAVLVGASLLGVLGALLAIPVAGAIQIVVKDWWWFRKNPGETEPPPPGLQPPGDGDPPGEGPEGDEGGGEPEGEPAPPAAPPAPEPA